MEIGGRLYPGESAPVLIAEEGVGPRARLVTAVAKRKIPSPFWDLNPVRLTHSPEETRNA